MAKGLAKDGAKMIEDAVDTFWDTLKHLINDLLVAFLIFVLLIFVVGELYAVFFMQSGNPLMLWLPVFLLFAALAYKVLD